MSFALDLRAFADKAKAKMDAVVRRTVQLAHTKIDLRSPVGDPTLWSSPPPPGYVGGRFRNNNQYAFGAPPEGILDGVDPTGEASRARVLAAISNAPAAGVHYIANNLPYARALEDGHSTQAPQGMYGLTAMELRSMVDQVVRGEA